MKLKSIVYFGTGEFSVGVLNELKEESTPHFIVTSPDKKIGRKHILTPPPVKVWAQEHHVPFLQFASLKDAYQKIKSLNPDLFIVASYGYLLNEKLLALPKYGSLNVHPSLLPLHRGACPIESTILSGESETGSSIMLMSPVLDKGPVLVQSRIPLDSKVTKPELFKQLAKDGGKLLHKHLHLYLTKKIIPQKQDNTKATYCKKIKKENGNITKDSEETKWRKYRAYYGWPGVFFFNGKERIKVEKARYENERFLIERVTPAGKKEMSYKQYCANNKSII